MKYSILLALLMWTQALIGQEANLTAEQVRNFLIEDFKDIPTEEFVNLVPYYEGKKWGVINLQGEILIPAKYNSIKLAKPNIKGFYAERIEFEIHPKDRSFVVIDRKLPRRTSSTSSSIAPKVKQGDFPFPKSSANGFIGFEMDEEYNITYYSNIFNASDVDQFNISPPFLIDGKYYAVARKKSGPQIIDQAGIPLSTFDLECKILHPLISISEDIMWFYFEDSLGKGGFVNHLGTIKMYDELLAYPLNSGNKFGLNVQRNKEKTLFGVLDLANQSWYLAPQPIRFTQIRYATGEENVDKNSHLDRDKVNLYYGVFDRNERYFMDKNLNKLIPRGKQKSSEE